MSLQVMGVLSQAGQEIEKDTSASAVCCFSAPPSISSHTPVPGETPRCLAVSPHTHVREMRDEHRKQLLPMQAKAAPCPTVPCHCSMINTL